MLAIDIEADVLDLDRRGREVEVAEQNRQRAVVIEQEKVTRAQQIEIVAREREVWYPNPLGRWIGDEKWNRRCEKDHRKFFNLSRWQSPYPVTIPRHATVRSSSVARIVGGTGHGRLRVLLLRLVPSKTMLHSR